MDYWVPSQRGGTNRGRRKSLKVVTFVPSKGRNAGKVVKFYRDKGKKKTSKRNKVYGRRKRTQRGGINLMKTFKTAKKLADKALTSGVGNYALDQLVKYRDNAKKRQKGGGIFGTLGSLLDNVF